MKQIVKYPLLIILLLIGFTTWQIHERTNSASTPDPLKDATALYSWFPALKERLKYGTPDTWRSPQSNDKVDSEVIDPIAERTFLMLKTGADVMFDRVPIHLDTTLKRFPYHQIYADSSAKIGNEAVVDIISMIPDAIISDQLPGYRMRKQQLEESWGWDSRQIKQENSEGWQTDKYKNVPMMLHAFRNAPSHCDWFVFVDDDTYIHSQSLGSLLRDLNPQDHHYIGSAALIKGGLAETGKVGEELKAKNQDSQVDLWFAHGGSAVVVSRGAVEALFWDPQREDDIVKVYSDAATHCCCGDAVFGYMVREELRLFINSNIDSHELTIDPFQGETFATTGLPVTSGGFCSRLLSWHHLQSWEIQRLFEWERSLLSRKPNTELGVLYSDVYHDFMLPFITPVRKHWNIGSLTNTYQWNDQFIDNNVDDGEKLYPASSEEACIGACKVSSRCLGWKYQYLSTNNTCSLEFNNLKRGVSSNPLKNSLNGDYVVSGWMVDRIRTIRSGEICDQLQYNQDTREYSDSAKESEGWYFRRLAIEQDGKGDQPVYA